MDIDYTKYVLYYTLALITFIIMYNLIGSTVYSNVMLISYLFIGNYFVLLQYNNNRMSGFSSRLISLVLVILPVVLYYSVLPVLYILFSSLVLTLLFIETIIPMRSIEEDIRFVSSLFAVVIELLFTFFVSPVVSIPMFGTLILIELYHTIKFRGGSSYVLNPV